MKPFYNSLSMSFLDSKRWCTNPASLYPELHTKRVIEVDGVHYLSRYEDVAALLNSPDVSNMLGSPEGTPLRESVLQQDPPAHGRIRKTTGSRLNKQPVEKLRKDIENDARKIFNEIKSKGQMEFVSSVAQKMPLMSLKSMFSMEDEEIKRLASHVKAFVSRGSSNLPKNETLQLQGQDLAAIHDFFRDFIQQRQAANERQSQDLLTVLMDSMEMGELTQAELLDMCLILTIGGVETTSTALSSILMLMEENSWCKDLVQNDPKHLPALIEETLRLESPIKYSSTRTAKLNTNINGIRFAPGTPIVGLFGAANRDPDIFQNPNDLSLSRKGKPHLGFGYGVHYCVGAHFARLQMQVVLEILFEELPTWRVVRPPSWKRWIGGQTRQWSPNPLIRGLASLPLVWETP